MPLDPDTSLGGVARRDFPTTAWSQLAAGAGADEPARRRALETLARGYWKPVYAYLRARRSLSNEDAKDLTQDFFAWMAETDFLARADRSRGRFRAFLKTALDHYLSHEQERRRALKRGGGQVLLAMDDLPKAEIIDPRGRAPEEVLDEAWRAGLLTRATEMSSPTTRPSQAAWAPGLLPTDWTQPTPI